MKKDIEAAVKISRYVEKKLSNLQDDEFIDEVARFISTDLMFNYILQFFVKDQNLVLNSMKEALNEIYGENSLFVKNMIKNYILEYLKNYNIVNKIF